MEKEMNTFSIVSGSDGLILQALEVKPAEAPRGVVVLVHGMAEHKERYVPFMEFLADLGYASLIHDHRGHGGSVKSEEDLGFLYEDGATAIVEDVQCMVEEAKKRYPGLPIHLFGHSMGSLVVRNYLEKHDEEITSLTISGCVAANPAAGVGKLLASVVGKVKGDHYRSPLITKIAFGSYNDHIPNPRSFYSWLNTDKEAVANYEADDLCGFTFTTNGYEALMELILRCYNEKRYQKKNTEIPILFLSGSDDPCCSGEKGFNGAVDFLKNIGYTNVSGVMLPKMRHEILNEPEHEKVYQLIGAHLAAAGMK